MKQIELNTAWKTNRESGMQVCEHEHDFYELVYYCDGEGITKVGGQSIDISSSICVLIPPHMPHEDFYKKNCKVYCIGFSYQETLDIQIIQDYRGIIKTIVNAIVTEVSEQHPLYREMAQLKLGELIIQLQRQNKKTGRAVTKDFEYVIGYIRQNYHEKILLKEFAEHLHLSYDYFQHRFKEHVGESPQQFLVHTRLEAAKQLLKDSNLNCTEIAQRCGFSNSAQFSTIFKKEENVRPREYQKNCQ